MPVHDPLACGSASTCQPDKAVALRAADGSGDGASPRTVIRGESLERGEVRRLATVPVRVLTDWLNVTIPFFPSGDALRQFVQDANTATAGVLGSMVDRNRGLHGYTHSCDFDCGGAMFAYGGQRNTALLSLTSEACALVPGWDRFVDTFRLGLAGRITRWDGAVDDFEGIHSVDSAVEMYHQGGFTSGGRLPSVNVAGDWITANGGGRTLYIGRRKNGKLLRVYEKGKQLGDMASLWVRWEVELHNVDREIPWDVLLRPSHYVAGAYPCMAWIGEERSRIRTIKAQDAISYDRLTEVASNSYGPLVSVMLKREGSPERVMEILRRPGVPKRLAFSTEFLRSRGDDANL